MKKIVVGTLYTGKDNKPYKKYWDTKGVDSIMGVSIQSLRETMKNPSDDFLMKLEAAEEKAKEYGEKALAFFKESGHHFIVGFSYSYYDLKENGGYRFWFEVASEPEYSL